MFSDDLFTKDLPMEAGMISKSQCMPENDVC